MLVELVRGADKTLHAIRHDAKYWTLCGKIGTVRGRWHTEPQTFVSSPGACAVCARACLPVLGPAGA